MFANPLTLIILLLFLLFVCLSLLIWFALTLRNPVASRQRAGDGVKVRESKHRAKPKTGAQTQPTVALRGSAALLEDAQTKARTQPTNALTPNTPPHKAQAEREARLEAIKAQRAYSAAKFVDKPVNKDASAAPTRTAPASREPELERAKRESPFPSPPRYEPQRQVKAVQADVSKPSNPKLGNPEPSKREPNDPRIKDPRIKDPRMNDPKIRNKGGTPVRVRPVASAPDIPTKPDVPKTSEQTSAEPQQKPAEKPKRKQPDAFEQFIRSKNDDFDL